MSGEGREQTMMQILVPSLFPFKNKTEHGMSMAACWNNWQIYVTRDVIDNYMEYRKYIKKKWKERKGKNMLYNVSNDSAWENNIQVVFNSIYE